MKPALVTLPISTSHGEFLAHYSENGLAELDFPRGKASRHCATPANGVPAKIQAWHRVATAALKKFMAGQQPEELPPLDLAGTPFQKSVWRQMLKIPCGKTRSYGEIAKAIGKPAAVRAVGGACGANNIPVFVPCHRVLAANQKIGGFSGGLGWKIKLLELEGASL